MVVAGLLRPPCAPCQGLNWPSFPTKLVPLLTQENTSAVGRSLSKNFRSSAVTWAPSSGALQNKQAGWLKRPPGSALVFIKDKTPSVQKQGQHTQRYVRGRYEMPLLIYFKLP